MLTEIMKTLFSKILLAQVVAVVLALLVVTVITRASLNQGFKAFLTKQEASVLENLAYALGEYYDSRGNWDYLANNSENWQRIWRLSRIQQAGSAEGRPPQNTRPQTSRPTQGRPAQGRPDERRQGDRRPSDRREAQARRELEEQLQTDQGQSAPPPGGLPPRRNRNRDQDQTQAQTGFESAIEAKLMRWARSPDHANLKERLFLLDKNKTRISGAEINGLDSISLEAVSSAGQVVGWIGFSPMGNVLPPDAQLFLNRQIRITIIALAIALVVAATLAFLLARNVSRPVKRLGNTLRELSQGEYLARVEVESKDEIGSLATRVNQLADSLEKNRTARQRWMADIAHELRTPVSILKGEIEALADGIRKPDQRMVTSLREEVDQLSTLINDLQTLALSDAGALNIQKLPLDLTALINQCTDTFHDRFAQREIELTSQLADRVIIEADATRLRQLLHNLLENCCRYVDQAGQVKLSLMQTRDRTELLLEDSGPGLENDQIERLFERFYRVEGSRSRSTGGTGLGLSICKNIVEAHGGSIEAGKSEMGGLKISITLPV
jgi:two-component system sensor histidine kinase BaeS